MPSGHTTSKRGRSTLGEQSLGLFACEIFNTSEIYPDEFQRIPLQQNRRHLWTAPIATTNLRTDDGLINRWRFYLARSSLKCRGGHSSPESLQWPASQPRLGLESAGSDCHRLQRHVRSRRARAHRWDSRAASKNTGEQRGLRSLRARVQLLL